VFGGLSFYDYDLKYKAFRRFKCGFRLLSIAALLTIEAFFYSSNRRFFVQPDSSFFELELLPKCRGLRRMCNSRSRSRRLPIAILLVPNNIENRAANRVSQPGYHRASRK